MPKAIINWNSKSRKIPFMCCVCGKKYSNKKQATTCEWADLKGISRKATMHNKRAKERKKEHANNICDQSERRCREDNDINQHGNTAGESLGEACVANRQ